MPAIVHVISNLGSIWQRMHGNARPQKLSEDSPVARPTQTKHGKASPTQDLIRSTDKKYARDFELEDIKAKGLPSFVGQECTKDLRLA